MKQLTIGLLIMGILPFNAFGQHAFLTEYYNPGALYTVDLDNPADEVFIGNTTGFLADVEFGPENILYGLSLFGAEFYQIDTTSAITTQIGSVSPLAGHLWTGLAYDNTSGVMYASSTDDSESGFYTIDLDAISATLIGSSTDASSVADIAFDATGQMYGHHLPMGLYEIDKTTGVATYVGSTGFPAAGPWHGMDYCHENDNMYLATYNSASFVRSIMIIDLDTGATTIVGPARTCGGFAITNPECFIFPFSL